MIMMLQKRRRESGQTLLVGVMALLLLLLAVVFVFDLQSVIRAKYKTKTAVDAAAIAGANWQRHTLNMLGDINLIKASNLMMEGFPGGPSAGFSSDGDTTLLAECNQNLTEMQVRISFVGPLIGFGAAQQAAKANGLNFRKEYGEVIREHLDKLEGSDVYLPPNVSEGIEGYKWREAYIRMLYALYEDGNGAAVGGNMTSILYPNLKSTAPQFIGYLQTKEIYEAILGNYWCGVRHLLREDFSGGSWWGNIEVAFNSAGFVGESEYLPVGISFSHTAQNFETASELGAFKPYMEPRGMREITDGYDRYNPNEKKDGDGKYDPIRYLSWCTFDNQFWGSYGDEMSDVWAGYLRAPIAERYRYYGCNAKMRTVLDPVAMSGKVLPVSSLTNSPRIAEGKKRLENGLYQMKATAVAKPMGYLETEKEGNILPHLAARMIFPCFKQSVLIPTSLESSDEVDPFDYEWYAFLTEYLPALGTVGSIEEMGPNEIGRAHV